MWRHIAQSLQGASHLGDGTPCQDSHSVRLLGDARSSTLVACFADGAGSAKHSDVGSAIACDAILFNAIQHYEKHDGVIELEMEDVLRWCEEARARLLVKATEQGCPIRQLATTLGVAIIGPENSYFFQIGDGAIILGNGSLYGVVFWPQSGEYANTTNFLTADEYQSQLEFFTTKSRFSKVALMTDGLERLALRFDSQTPHAPFFEPLFRALQSTDNVDGLNDNLRSFLGSDSIKTRSDDDKTLILATRHGAA